ncbi:peptide MFS transporter [Prevotella sp. kh1p2]|uniref:peptide MFS transporter n=1 Tax=Prevotella sp. kh1p2 TaxID=1761883 RepID=UPI0008B23A43|nr:peptide MFS transporter [Prevotella sp. kh1p2]SET14867.1 proton-dependent oligopeptide transporter, POT family [Prevotella sp. kh1p2]SNU11967.1 proton-dependent oligopeptide transporter, POT family [Prevotellaceae bacterium KH2P17]
MFENQPKGLYALALANTGERFGYYTMIAVFALFLRANFGLAPGTAGLIYSIFLALVYVMPLVGGALADKFGYGKMVTAGVLVMFAGYLFLSIPLGRDTFAMVCMLAALVFISFGTGLFKGNLQVMVGNLYDEPQYSKQRDSGFSIFYMAINIGALFAPTAAVKIKEWAESIGYASNDAYHFSFAVACASLILSIAIYYGFRSTFRHVEGNSKQNAVAEGEVQELSKQETKERIIALCLVFAVVVFFWMAFHQNGLTLTYFANEFVKPTSEGIQSMAFDVVNLVMIIFIVYGLFGFFQSKTGKGKGIATAVILAACTVLYYKYTRISGAVEVSAPIFQQFNPFYVVALTPVSMSIFSYLASKGKEPSAPRKIAYGMLVAGSAYGLMILASVGLLTPDAQAAAGDNATFTSANWLIGTYLILTFGELLLSPMGISFVSKVAPPKYKGLMMGGWFVATAFGNMLVSVGGFLWGGLPLWTVWLVFIVLCLLSFVFMMAIMKKLEKVC